MVRIAGLIAALVACSPLEAARQQPIDLATAWTRTAITAGSPTGARRGADGVAVDAEGCIVTPWEEGGAVTRACPSGGGWITEQVATGLPGVEDAKAADLDGDGVIDVVSCSDGGGRCYVTFRGAPNVTTTLTGSQGHGRAMQAAIGDISGDGLPDIAFGTRAGSYASPAVIGWLENPGVTARTGSTWAYHLVDLAGWVMALVLIDVDHDGDLDIVTSDRSYVYGPGGTHLWDRYGARWLEQTTAGWVSHAISPPSGSCPVGQPLCATKTPGDERFLTVDGDTVWDCQSSTAAAYSRIVKHSTADWLTWTHEVLPPAANVSHCQGIAITDVDGDGRADVVVSGWKGDALPLASPIAGTSAVYWLRDDGAGTWERGEISGTAGGKYDNVIRLGACVVTSEELDPAGGLGVVEYCPPGGAP